jgi:hypothetical protein
MKYATVEDVIAGFLYPVLPTVQGKPDYQTIHATRKFLQANSRAIDTHFGGGTLSDESTLRSKDIMEVFHLISRPTL